jgi:ubiquinone/menaquinone biosynthesis C-methylase UbiE
MPEQYIHGATDEREIARLEKQAAFIARTTWTSLNIAPGSLVLDLATGVGAMAHQLELRFLDLRLVGVDLSTSQLRASRKNHSQIPVLRADATQLPFADETFDVVHCSWLLEHVPSPLSVLKETRRVLKRGGYCHFIEVDNATFHASPALPLVDQLMRMLNAKQMMLGGDPYVGQRMAKLFAQAGFSRFAVDPFCNDVTPDNQREFEALVEEFAEIFDGLDESLGAELPALAAAELRGLGAREGARLKYTCVRAVGHRIS